MANTLTALIPKLLAQGVLALRENAIMARLVNRRYESIAGEKGSTIDVPIPSAIAVQDVSPAATPPSIADIAPTKVALALDKWKEAPFYLTDKERLEVMEGTIPMQASEAVKALANQIDRDILALYKEVYGFAGVAGTTPFGTDLSEWLDARKVLNQQLAPFGDRRVVLGVDAAAKALGLRAFQDQMFGGGAEPLALGQFASKLGAAWFEDQNIPTHTASSSLAGVVNDAGAVAAGAKALTVDGFNAAPNVGDIFTIAGDTQTYVVTEGTTATQLNFKPGLKVALPTGDNNEVITIKGDHVVNLAFHPDAFALAMRPFSGSDPDGLGMFSSAVDPVSGLVLRLEVSREHKRTRFSYDTLYGVKTVRPGLATRIAG